MKTIDECIEIILKENKISLSLLDQNQLNLIEQGIFGAQSIHVIATGRSELVMRMFAMRLMHLGLKVSVIGDVTAPPVNPGSLVLMASCSGESEILAVLAKKSKSAGARILTFTDGTQTGLTQYSDDVVVIRASEEQAGGQFADSLFEQSLLLLLDAWFMRVREGRQETNLSLSMRLQNLA